MGHENIVLKLYLSALKIEDFFLKVASATILNSMLVSFPQLSLANNSIRKGIVKNADEGETYFVRENTAITIKVSKQKDGVDSVSICTEEIPSADGIHKHLNNDEIFFFHKDNGTFFLDEQEFIVSEGSTAFVPKGVWHELKNTGNELLVFHILKTCM